jgi:hypothetical protein
MSHEVCVVRFRSQIHLSYGECGWLFHSSMYSTFFVAFPPGCKYLNVNAHCGVMASCCMTCAQEDCCSCKSVGVTL